MIKKPEIWVVVFEEETREVIAERSTSYWNEMPWLTNQLKKIYETYIKEKNKSENKKITKSDSKDD